MKATKGQATESIPERSSATAGRPVRLGSYTYLPASVRADATKGVLMKGGLPVTLEATEDILHEFMYAMSSLERDVSQRWEAWTSGSAFHRRNDIRHAV
jgi:hypothetical protein